MKKNETIELSITDMGVNGEGIGKADGYTFFVKNAVIGDTVSAVITKMKKGYGYAKMLQVLPSLIYLRDANGRYVFSSQYWHHLEHYDDPDWSIRGKTDMEIRKDTENAKRAYESDLRVIRNGVGSDYVIEENEDGIHEYLQIIKEPLRDSEGRVRGIIAIINDVTEQEKLRRELRKKSVRKAMC